MFIIQPDDFLTLYIRTFEDIIEYKDLIIETHLTQMSINYLIKIIYEHYKKKSLNFLLQNLLSEYHIY